MLKRALLSFTTRPNTRSHIKRNSLAVQKTSFNINTCRSLRTTPLNHLQRSSKTNNNNSNEIIMADTTYVAVPASDRADLKDSLSTMYPKEYYPEIEPNAHGLLDVGDGHEVYWEESGQSDPNAPAALFLHGGPGMLFIISIYMGVYIQKKLVLEY